MSDYEYGDQDGWGDDAEENNEADPWGNGGDNGDDDVNVKIENSFYEGEQYRTINPTESLRKFEEVLDLESAHNLNEKTFKCLEMITVLSGDLGDYDK